MRRRQPHRGRSGSSALFLFLSAWLAFAGPAAGDEIAQVERALDGDSVLLTDGRQIRLIGINAPEFGKDGRPDQPLASVARERLAALIKGRAVRLIFDREPRDRHRRALAYAELPDGTDVQQRLLREGLAWFVAVPPNVSRIARYQAAEAEARAAGRGVWAPGVYAPRAAEHLTSEQTGFQRLTGVVRDARVTRHGIELRLGPAVSVVLAPAVAAALGETPRSLRGKRVLARGWVTEYKNRFRLRVTHAAMLEDLR